MISRTWSIEKANFQHWIKPITYKDVHVPCSFRQAWSRASLLFHSRLSRWSRCPRARGLITSGEKTPRSFFSLSVPFFFRSFDRTPSRKRGLRLESWPKRGKNERSKRGRVCPDKIWFTNSLCSPFFFFLFLVSFGSATISLTQFRFEEQVSPGACSLSIARSFKVYQLRLESKRNDLKRHAALIRRKGKREGWVFQRSRFSINKGGRDLCEKVASLLSRSFSLKRATPLTLPDTERGNVRFFTGCAVFRE